VDWEKEMLSQISLYDIYKEFKDSDMYQKLVHIGNEMYPATQYGNVYKIEDDPFSSARYKIILTAYYLGVASFIQLEQALYLNRGSNLEYPYAITLRSMIELIGRVHKGIRLLKTYQQNKNKEEFINGSRRLITSFIPNSNGAGGYNVMTLVQSLKDKIPDIEVKYDKLSDYLHGNVVLHATYRRISYLHSLTPPEDAPIDEVMAALKGSRISPFIEMYNDLLESLRNVLIDDLKFSLELAKPLADRYNKYIQDKNNCH
jgi:hypothetical protein